MKSAATVSRRFSSWRHIVTVALILLLPLVVLATLHAPETTLPPDENTRQDVKAEAGATRDPGELLRRAQATAAAQPLEPAPFAVAAAAAEVQGDTKRATMLMLEAARRRLSFAPAHIWLTGHFLREGHVTWAVEQADLAMRADASARTVLIPLLVPQLHTSTGLSAIIDAIDRLPSWRDDFISAAIKEGVEPDAVFGILTRRPPGIDSERLDEHRRVFISRLMAAGDADRAYLAWISFLPSEAVGEVNTVYDGNFHHFPGVAPFNWTLTTDPGGTAEYGYEGSSTNSFLDTMYTATTPLNLANQTLYLSPGNWRFSVKTRITRNDSGGSLRWRLTCLPGNNEIGAIDMEDTQNNWRTMAAGVSVPAEGCIAQLLVLQGVPGETRSPASGQFREVRMAHQDHQQ